MAAAAGQGRTPNDNVPRIPLASVGRRSDRENPHCNTHLKTNYQLQSGRIVPEEEEDEEEEEEEEEEEDGGRGGGGGGGGAFFKATGPGETGQRSRGSRCGSFLPQPV